MASPWSVATKGLIEAEAVAVRLDTDEDLARAKGRLAGKIVLLGAPKAASAEPAVVRYTDAEVLKGDAAEAVRAYYRTVADRRARQGGEGLFKARRNAFLAAEGVAAVVFDGGGAEPGVMVVDGSDLGGRPWLAAERPAFPALCVTGEAYARCWRLSQAGVPVRLQLEIATEEGDPAEPGYNVRGRDPRRDPALKSQVVLAGAHLDSWAAGAGAAGQRRGRGGDPGSRPHPARPGPEAPPHDPGGALWRRGAGALRLGGLCPPAAGPHPALDRARADGPASGGPPGQGRSAAQRDPSTTTSRRPSTWTGIGPHPGRLHRRKPRPGRALSRLDRAAEGPGRVLAVYDGPHWPADQSTFTEIGLPGIRSCRTRSTTTAAAHHPARHAGGGCRRTTWPRRPPSWRSS